MIVNKFGGASIKDAPSIMRMSKICSEYISYGIIVVSAMGKTTNKLEKITENYFYGFNTNNQVHDLKDYYMSVANNLFPASHEIFKYLNETISNLEQKLSLKAGINYDFEYDQIVSFGELISTKIISSYLGLIGYEVKWVDIRNSLKTDSTFREGNINWELTSSLVQQEFGDYKNKVILTQGFIGSDINNLPTTLGREGSDYTAAVLASILNCNKVVVWKDVPGILCADPKWMENTQKLDEISYLEAIELTYFGAQVIHPKTIKPLQNKGIPLQVKSFIDPKSSGTIIHNTGKLNLPPIYIKKENQILVTIKPIDFSFIVEENLSTIFKVFSNNQIKVNVMQNSALNFSVVVDGEFDRVKSAIRELKKQFNVKYNDNLELISIRHTSPEAEKLVTKGRKLLLEQHSRSTARFLVRNLISD